MAVQQPRAHEQVDERVPASSAPDDGESNEGLSSDSAEPVEPLVGGILHNVEPCTNPSVQSRASGKGFRSVRSMTQLNTSSTALQNKDLEHLVQERRGRRPER